MCGCGVVSNAVITRTYASFTHNGILSFNSAVTGGPTNSYSVTYDPGSRVSAITAGPVSAAYACNGDIPLVTSLTVNAQGCLLTKTVQWDYANARPLAVTYAVSNAGTVASFGYQYAASSDRIAKMTFADGSTRGYTYDNKGQLLTADAFLSDGVTPVLGRRFSFAYDAIGNVTKAGPVDAADAPRYSFDCDDRNVHVVRAWGRNFEIAGTAVAEATVKVGDAVARRLGMQFFAVVTVNNEPWAIRTNIVVKAFMHDPALGKDVVACATGTLFVAQATETPAYDAKASLAADSRFAYTWDAFGRLTGAVSEVAPKTRIAFTYYPDGRRASKKVYRQSGQDWTLVRIHQFYYDGWNLVAEKIMNSGNNEITNFSYTWGLDLAGHRSGRAGQEAGGIGGLLAVTVTSNGTDRVYLPIADANGNIRKVVDAQTRSVAAEYDYDPFGVPVAVGGTQPDACPFRFQSKYHDRETGLYYFGYRYYDPKSCKWLCRDPLQEKGGVNLTAYCANDPVNRQDPLGLTAYAVYRQLGITGLGWTWYAGRLAGHVYLAFDDKNMGTAWQETLKRHGYTMTDTPNPQNYREYKDKITFSFHPWSVKTVDATGNHVSVVYTEGSWVDINNYVADVRPIVKDEAIAIPLTTDEVQQIKLFETAQLSANINRASMKSADHGDYSFAVNNCADWAQWITQQSGLSWPACAYLWNGGTSVGGPLDYTLLPQLTYGVSVAGYHTYHTVKTGGQIVGSGVYTGAKVVGQGIYSGAATVGQGVKTVVENAEWFPADISSMVRDESRNGVVVRW